MQPHDPWSESQAVLAFHLGRLLPPSKQLAAKMNENYMAIQKFLWQSIQSAEAAFPLPKPTMAPGPISPWQFAHAHQVRSYLGAAKPLNRRLISRGLHQLPV